jgi:carbonic anhydrase
MTLSKQLLPRFDPRQFGTIADLENAARGGRAQILLICCSDHYSGPNNLSVADPDRLTVVQNLAAAIPPAGQTRGLTTLASIEYAVVLRNACHAIICGHRRCGVLDHLLKSQSDAELSLSPAASDRNEAMLPNHVLQQAVNLRSHEFIRHRLDDGRLLLHVWIVDDQTAGVDAYDPSRRQFRKLSATATDQVERHLLEWSQRRT